MDSEIVKKETASATAVFQQISEIKVETPEHIALAVEIIGDVKKRWTEVEEKRKTVTKPLNEALKSANALFKPALDALAGAEAMLKRKVATAQQAIAAANRAAMEATQKALAQGNVREAALASMSIETTEAPAKASFTPVWKFRVVDADLVPREFCAPDEKKIRAYVVAHGDRTSIPGVEVVPDVQVAVRR